MINLLAAAFCAFAVVLGDDEWLRGLNAAFAVLNFGIYLRRLS